MRIVTNGDKYAIQKGWIFKKYKSLNCPDLWWDYENSLFYCWTTREECENYLKKLKGEKYLKVVK